MPASALFHTSPGMCAIPGKDGAHAVQRSARCRLKMAHIPGVVKVCILKDLFFSLFGKSWKKNFKKTLIKVCVFGKVGVLLHPLSLLKGRRRQEKDKRSMTC